MALSPDKYQIVGNGITLDLEDPYILSSIDFGSAKENLATVVTRSGSLYSNSTLATRNVSMVIYVCGDNVQDINDRCHVLQSIMSPFKEFRLKYFYRTSGTTYTEECEFRLRLNSTIEWGSDISTNNSKFIMATIDCVALNPYVFKKIRKNSSTGDYSILMKGQPVIIGKQESASPYTNKNRITINNLGTNPYLDFSLRFNTSPGRTMYGMILILDETALGSHVSASGQYWFWSFANAPDRRMLTDNLTRVEFYSESGRSYGTLNGVRDEFSKYTDFTKSTSIYIPAGEHTLTCYYFSNATLTTYNSVLELDLLLTENTRGNASTMQFLEV